MKERELPMMLDDTMKAFDCCVNIPPLCGDCPCNDECKDKLWKGKDDIKRSVRYWLSQVDDTD